MPQCHTEDDIRELDRSVFDEWEIPPSKVSATLTDNGNNMVAAFRPQVVEDDDVEDEGDQDQERGEDADLPSLVQGFEEKELDHELTFTGQN